LLLLRCTASLTTRRFGRCLRRTLGDAAAVKLTFSWRFVFCLAELHLTMISVFRRFCYTATVCGAPKLRLRKLICFAYEKGFIRLLTACAGSAHTG